MKKVILYLDIDGVLCAFPNKKEEYPLKWIKQRYDFQTLKPEALRLLDNAIKKASNQLNVEISVALCSTWRLSPDLILDLIEQWPALSFMRVRHSFVTRQINNNDYVLDIFSQNKFLFDAEIESERYKDRGIEVQDHFDRLKPEYAGYIMVDDETSHYYTWQHPYIVNTDPEIGFNFENYKELINKVKTVIDNPCEKQLWKSSRLNGEKL